MRPRRRIVEPCASRCCRGPPGTTRCVYRADVAERTARGVLPPRRRPTSMMRCSVGAGTARSMATMSALAATSQLPRCSRHTPRRCSSSCQASVSRAKHAHTRAATSGRTSVTLSAEPETGLILFSVQSSTGRTESFCTTPWRRMPRHEPSPANQGCESSSEGRKPRQRASASGPVAPVSTPSVQPSEH